MRKTNVRHWRVALSSLNKDYETVTQEVKEWIGANAANIKLDDINSNVDHLLDTLTISVFYEPLKEEEVEDEEV